MPSKPPIHKATPRRSPAQAWVELDARRPNSARRGYDARWRRARLMFLARNPFCVHCGAPANEVDHVIPKRRGGLDDESNWQALCGTCHKRKTQKEIQEDATARKNQIRP